MPAAPSAASKAWEVSCVLAVIADALESKTTKLRWPVGPDAEQIMSARATLDDVQFAAMVRNALNLTW